MLDNTGDQSDVMSPLVELGSLLANINNENGHKNSFIGLTTFFILFILLPGASLLSNIPMYSCTSYVVKRSTAHCFRWWS